MRKRKRLREILNIRLEDGSRNSAISGSKLFVVFNEESADGKAIVSKMEPLLKGCCDETSDVCSSADVNAEALIQEATMGAELGTHPNITATYMVIPAGDCCSAQGFQWLGTL